MKAIQDQRQVKTIQNYTYDEEDIPLISKQKEIFNELVDERLKEITELDKKVNYDDLIYKYKSNTKDIEFNQFDNTFSLLNKIRDGKISLTNAKKIKKNLKKILEKQKGETPNNIKNLNQAWKEVSKFFDDYSSMVFEAKNEFFKDYQ